MGQNFLSSTIKESILESCGVSHNSVYSEDALVAVTGRLLCQRPPTLSPYTLSASPHSLAPMQHLVHLLPTSCPPAHLGQSDLQTDFDFSLVTHQMEGPTKN